LVLESRLRHRDGGEQQMQMEGVAKIVMLRLCVPFQTHFGHGRR